MLVCKHVGFLICWLVLPVFGNDDFKSNTERGIVKTKPMSGRFVPIKDGFMVPYEVTYPGTKVKFSMVPIPGGKFTLGSPASESDRNDDEGPQFEIVVEPFWMGKHEVTWAEYKPYMELSVVFRELQSRGLRKVDLENEVDAVTGPSALYDPSYTFDVGEGNDQPAATMTQFAAKQYTKWLSLTTENFYRLPTEAEWEYACRAGTKTAYYFGNDPSKLKEHAWFDGNSGDERQAVGQLKANPWGLHDMHGNVAEWVLDGYNKDGYQFLAQQKVSQSPLTTIQAYAEPSDIHPITARGGSFELSDAECRSASRLGSTKDWGAEDPEYPKSPWWYIDSPASGVGIRVVRPLEFPEDAEDRESCWSDPKVFEIAKQRIRDVGKGSYGTVDPKLPSDAIKLKRLKNRK